MSLIPVLAKELHVNLGEGFKLKPKHGNPYPAEYRFQDDELLYRPGPNCHWTSISGQSMQLRIFFNLLRGFVEVVKNEQK